MPVRSRSSPAWEVTVPLFVSLNQEALSGFAEAVGTAFACLLVSGRVVTATESWWRLGTPEAVLLPWLVGSLPPQAARDYPVYLPHGSPTVSGGARRGKLGAWDTCARRGETQRRSREEAGRARSPGPLTPRPCFRSRTAF